MTYLSEIENAFSRGRGKFSRLNPLDWNLAQSWEDAGVPLRIVLRAMGDVFTKFNAQNRSGNINSLSYFKQEVEKQYTEWLKSQVGKNLEETMPSYSTTEALSPNDETYHLLDTIAHRLSPKWFERYDTVLPDPLLTVIAQIRGEVLALLTDLTPKQLSTDTVENRLKQLQTQLNAALFVAVSDEEREQMRKSIREEYGKIRLLDDSMEKLLTRELYRKFHLPELTLFVL